jgi:hypothetical protein
MRSTLSTLLVVCFALILIFLGLFAEVFESQTPEIDEVQIYTNPIPLAEMQTLKSIRLTNKLGSFLLENTDLKGKLDGPWQMVSPQALVKPEIVFKIIDALTALRVRNFHSYEPINITSFSLDNPSVTLNFITGEEKNIELKLGLINPIDNSAYLVVSTQNQIYQIDPLEITIESYDLAQLVESRVLALNLESLVSLEIYSEKSLELKLLKKDQGWVNQNGIILNNTKVISFFEKLENIKSFSILDKLTIEQQSFMSQASSKPTYSLKIISSQGVRTYMMSEIKGGIPGIPIDRNNFYALSSDEKVSFVLIEKDQMKVFGTKSDELK